jgi:hypothetical protein
LPLAFSGIAVSTCIGPSQKLCHPEPLQPPQDLLSSRPADIGGGGRSKDLKVLGMWHARRISRSFAVLRRQNALRKLFEHGWRLRLSQDDTIGGVGFDV